MPIDWQEKVQRPQLICHASGEQILPGDTYFSALIVADGRMERHDFTETAWQEHAETEHAYLSWWRHRRPDEKQETGPRIVNKEVLFTIFTDLKDSTERLQQCFAWLLALLLTRSKRLRYLDLVHEGDESYLIVEDRAAKEAHKIRDPRMSTAEEESVQNDFSKVFELPPEA